MSGLLGSAKQFFRWTVAVFVFAAGLHALTIYSLPSLIMDRAESRLLKAGEMNAAIHAPRVNSDSRGVVRPSPNLLYSLCVYNLEAGPLRVSSPVPEGYWSLSIYNNNTDNFFVLNDRQAGGDKVEFLLIGPESRADNPNNLPLIDAPTNDGIVLMRSLIGDEGGFPELDALRKNATCESFIPTPKPVVKPAEPSN